MPDGEVGYRVTVDLSQAEQELRSLRNSSDRSERAIRNLARTTSGDTRKAFEALANILRDHNRGIRRAQNRVRALDKELDRSADSTNRVVQEFRELKEETDGIRKQLSESEKAAGRFSRRTSQLESNNAALRESFTETRTEVGRLRGEIRRLSTDSRSLRAENERLAKGKRNLRDRVGLLSRSVSAQRKVITGLNRTLKTNETRISRLASENKRLRSVILRMGMLQRQLQRDLRGTNAQLKSYTSNITRAHTVTRQASRSGGFSILGLSPQTLVATALGFSTLNQIFANFGSELINTVSVYTELDSAQIGVVKTTNLVASELNELRGGFIDLAKVTGVSVVDFLNTAAIAGQLGVRGVRNLRDFSKTVTDLGIATDLTAERAAFTLQRLITITDSFDASGERFGSTITDLGNNAAATESEITELALRIAGAGTIANISESSILALAAAAASVGVNAEAGGTSFSRTIAVIDSAVKGGGDELRRFAAIAGVTADEFAKLFREDGARAIALFLKGIGDLNRAGADVFTILETVGLGGRRLQDLLLRLAGAQGTLEEFIDRANTAWSENNALTIEAQRRYESTTVQLQILGRRLRIIQREFGSRFVRTILVLSEHLGTMADFAVVFIAAFSLVKLAAIRAALASIGQTIALYAVVYPQIFLLAGAITGLILGVRFFTGRSILQHLFGDRRSKIAQQTADEIKDINSEIRNLRRQVEGGIDIDINVNIDNQQIVEAFEDQIEGLGEIIQNLIDREIENVTVQTPVSFLGLESGFFTNDESISRAEFSKRIVSRLLSDLGNEGVKTSDILRAATSAATQAAIDGNHELASAIRLAIGESEELVAINERLNVQYNLALEYFHELASIVQEEPPFISSIITVADFVERAVTQFGVSTSLARRILSRSPEAASGPGAPIDPTLAIFRQAVQQAEYVRQQEEISEGNEDERLDIQDLTRAYAELTRAKNQYISVANRAGIETDLFKEEMDQLSNSFDIVTGAVADMEERLANLPQPMLDMLDVLRTLTGELESLTEHILELEQAGRDFQNAFASRNVDIAFADLELAQIENEISEQFGVEYFRNLERIVELRQEHAKVEREINDLGRVDLNTAREGRFNELDQERLQLEEDLANLGAQIDQEFDDVQALADIKILQNQRGLLQTRAQVTRAYQGIFGALFGRNSNVILGLFLRQLQDRPGGISEQELNAVLRRTTAELSTSRRDIQRDSNVGIGILANQLGISTSAFNELLAPDLSVEEKILNELTNQTPILGDIRDKESEINIDIGVDTEGDIQDQIIAKYESFTEYLLGGLPEGTDTDIKDDIIDKYDSFTEYLLGGLPEGTNTAFSDEITAKYESFTEYLLGGLPAGTDKDIQDEITAKYESFTEYLLGGLPPGTDSSVQSEIVAKYESFTEYLLGGLPPGTSTDIQDEIINKYESFTEYLLGGLPAGSNTPIQAEIVSKYRSFTEYLLGSPNLHIPNEPSRIQREIAAKYASFTEYILGGLSTVSSVRVTPTVTTPTTTTPTIIPPTRTTPTVTPPTRVTPPSLVRVPTGFGPTAFIDPTRPGRGHVIDPVTGDENPLEPGLWEELIEALERNTDATDDNTGVTLTREQTITGLLTTARRSGVEP